MKIVKQSVEFIEVPNGEKILKNIERIARTCYKSENNITDDSARRLIVTLIKKGHEAMLEHESISVRFICDRGISHEIVRHRIASYAQESTRYCNYSAAKFGGEITVISPLYLTDNNYKIWRQLCEQSEAAYHTLISNGVSPQIARSVLPTCLKTEIVVTMNLREWRHFFKLRCANNAHPQMRALAIKTLTLFKESVPLMFDDIKP